MEKITLCGLVATTPRHIVSQDGLPISSFRLASTDGDNTNWFTITCFRQLAINVAVSVSKGDRIIVSGALRVRDWDNGERAGTSVEVEADSIGHDLSFGSSVFTRNTYQNDSNNTQTTSTNVETHSCNCGNCRR